MVASYPASLRVCDRRVERRKITGCNTLYARNKLKEPSYLQSMRSVFRSDASKRNYAFPHSARDRREDLTR